MASVAHQLFTPLAVMGMLEQPSSLTSVQPVQPVQEMVVALEVVRPTWRLAMGAQAAQVL